MYIHLYIFHKINNMVSKVHFTSQVVYGSKHNCKSNPEIKFNPIENMKVINIVLSLVENFHISVYMYLFYIFPKFMKNSIKYSFQIS